MARNLVATYLIETLHPQDALTAILRGQSVGNPTLLTPYETPEFLAQWQATGTIEPVGTNRYHATIQWPIANVAGEGINFLLSLLVGGQCDLGSLIQYQLIQLDLGSLADGFPRPRYGMAGLRQAIGVSHRPFIGGIIKPKIGLTPTQVATICQQMADGGIDFIKDDELLSNQPWCPLAKRVKAVSHALKGYQVLYAPCITGDGKEILKKAHVARDAGATALHLNLWCGLGAFLQVRRSMKLPLFFQKSGDKVWTEGPFGMATDVLYQLIHTVGADIAHVGMWGGYLSEGETILQMRMAAMQTTLPSFSCGMTPELASKITRTFGNDIMVTSGGWIHSRPEGITEAVKQLRRAVESASLTLAT